MLRSEVLAIKPFRHLWLGQAISQLGDSFYYVSFMFMVSALTNGNMAMVGFVGAAEALPFLLFSSYAGVLADRMDRRRIMLLSDLICASILGALATVVVLDPQLPVWTLFASAFGLSTIRAFFLPAKSAAIPNLVPSDLLLKANSLSMATQNVMPVIGLGFSAAVMGAIFELSPQWFFFGTIVFNASSFLGSAWFIALLPSIKPDRQDVLEKHPLADLRDGLKYIRGRHELTVLLVLSLFLNLSISPFFVIYMAANRGWFGNKPQTLALFEFFFFTGMIIGSVVVGKSNVKRPGLGYIWGLAVVGLAVAAMAFSRNFAWFCSWNVLAGIALPFGQIPLSTYLQATVPDAFRGRVNSALTMISMGTQPVGMSLGGFMLNALGLVNSFLVMGIGMGGVALGGLIDAPFRQMRLGGRQVPGAAVAELNVAEQAT